MTSSPPTSIDISSGFRRIAPAPAGVSVEVERTHEHAERIIINYNAKISAQQGVLVGDVSGQQYALKGLY